MRLDKFVSYALNISRSDSRHIIGAGRIKVNGRIVMKSDFSVDETRDAVDFDDERLAYRRFLYFMLNKPRGYVTSTRDPLHPTVLDLAGDYSKYNLFMTGRLDIDTEGFVLLTNDGKLAHKITSPKNNCRKKYYLLTEEGFGEEDIQLCREGFQIRDGKGRTVKTRPAELEILSDAEAYLTIYEGKHHQIKQMCRVLGKTLKYLKRIQIGPVALDPALKPGEYRPLTDEEINKLKNQFTLIAHSNKL